MNIIIDQSEGQGALWLGDYPAAMNQQLQKQNNIKTILTVAGGLNVKPDSNISHKILHYVIFSKYGEIHFNVLKKDSKKGSVLVHCRAGVSRSASTVIAYLMKKQNISSEQAIEFVKLKRSVVSPYIGFLKQLKQYQNQLTKLAEKNEIPKNQDQISNEEFQSNELNKNNLKNSSSMQIQK